MDNRRSAACQHPQEAARTPPGRFLDAGPSLVDDQIMRRVSAAVILLAVAAIGFRVTGSAHARTAVQPSPLRWISKHGYRLLVPLSWRQIDASYPSDHFTDLYVDPTDANARLVVVGSPCVHCVTIGLSSAVAFPTGTTGHHRLDRYRVAWSAPGPSWRPFFVWGTAASDPYRLDGLTWGGPALQQGYVEAGVWLPTASHPIATRILNSFTLSDGVTFVRGHK